MPKDRRANSSSFDRSMVSPYSRSSKISDRKKSKSNSPHVGDEKEWEKIRCPICMEHPHNAILLQCSSRDKGCRPFICDNSYRHSNCFDQFRKSSAAAVLHAPADEQAHQSKLVCPFCRGAVSGWDVVNPARKFMNLKTRNCSSETCGFSGNYAELRKHARREHPNQRPSETNPSRQSDWAIMEQQMEIDDALLYQSDGDLWPILDELVDDDFWSEGSFFDFPSGMSDVDDEVIEEMLSGLPISCFSLFPFSSDDDMNDSGSSRSGDRPDWSWAGPSDPRSDLADANRSRSMPLHEREHDLWNFRPRSGYERENRRTISSSRSSRRSRESDSNSSRLRSRYYSREYDGPESSRTRSSYHSREFVDPESSRTRSSYHREEEQPNSRSGSRFHRRDFTPPIRASASRRFPESFRETRRDRGRRGD